jgi:hypothetical protein
MLLALPFAVASCAAAPRGRRALIAALAAAAAALCWLAVFRKAPPHVYLPAMAWPLALAVVLPAGRPSSRAGRAAYAFAAVLAAVAAVRALAFQRAETVEGVARERAYVAALQPLRAAPDRVFVLWSTFPYQVAGPLRSGPWPFDRFLALGWPQRTPASARTLRALGYAGWWEALADPRVRLVAPVDAARWIEAYAARHRGLALTLAQEGSVPGFGVFRASIAPEAAVERVLRSAPAVPE